jgi:hypothetical protein
MDRDILREIMRLDGVEEPAIDRYFARVEMEAAAVVRRLIDNGIVPPGIVEHVEPIAMPATDPGAVNPLPPAVRALMADQWQRLLDAEPISESS